MKQQLNIKLSLLLSLLVVAGTWISCDKDDDDNGSNSTKTELINFGPTGAQHGDTIRFFGNNMDKVTEIDFTGGAKVMQNEFKKQTKTEIHLVVPDLAQEGLVTIKSPTGDVVSKTRFNLDVLPVITTITKESRPGDNVTIKGKFLDWVSGVTFARDKPATTIVSKKIDELVVKVPMDAQTGRLILFYGGTKSSQMETDTVKVTLPAVTSMTPNPVFHDANLTIAGTNLDLVTKITFNSVSTAVTSFVSQSATQIVVKVPGGTRKGKITLTSPSGVTVQSTQDLDVVLPVVTGLTPNPVLHQTDLTITGTNLDLANKITFAGTTTAVTSFVSQSATQIVVKVPAGAIKGKLVLGVTSGGTNESTMELDVVLPVITSIAPNPIAPGDNLTITGTNLNIATGVAFTGVGSPITSFVSQSPTQIVVTVPTGVLKGKVKLNVQNSTVQAESADPLGIIGGLPDLADFPFAIYTDALQNTFQDWSYTATHNFNSSAYVRQGSKSIMAVYADNGYQGVTFHAGTPAPVGSYTKLEFSVFGEPGTNGKKLNVVCNGNYGSPPQVTIAEGEWTTFQVNISSLKTPTPATIDEIVLQSAGWTGTIHIDHVGLRN